MKSGRELKHQGMDQAQKHANQIHSNWAELAFEYFKKYAINNKSFMAEEVRELAESIGFPQPPHNRAWGSIVNRAVKENIIIRLDYRPVKNPKAHQAICSFWESKIYQQQTQQINLFS